MVSYGLFFGWQICWVQQENCLWALKIFEQWKTKRNLQMQEMDSEAHIIEENILTMSKSELSYALYCFLLEVTNEKSEQYPHETLYSILISLQMYYHSKGI